MTARTPSVPPSSARAVPSWVRQTCSRAVPKPKNAPPAGGHCQAIPNDVPSRSGAVPRALRPKPESTTLGSADDALEQPTTRWLGEHGVQVLT